ncbi:hypothetical protein GJ496_000833 [Pomphorhynchus laevis]|nr:hypothetical protein GJ496_000833 [Pomphorhynchus laevis]
MTLSAIHILDQRGKALVSRSYRGNVDYTIIEKFMPLLLNSEGDADALPILKSTDDNTIFFYISQSNVYLVATTSSTECNVMLIFALLFKIVDVFTDYFTEVEEESIRDNFVLVYELLDEMLDFGYPQITDHKILQEYVLQESHRMEIVKPPSTVTNAVSWRSEGIKYRKNEVFLDVIESINLLVSSDGTVLLSEVIGSLRMRTYLSGMPELRLGLNDRILFENTGRSSSKTVDLEDVKFHQCVRLSRFENDRTIAFIPPDGLFELMYYRLNTHVKPLIWIESSIDYHAGSKIEFMIKAKSQFKRGSTANNVEIIIKVPPDVDTGKFKSTSGFVKYTPEINAMVWTIKSMPGGKEYLMRAQFKLPTVQSDDYTYSKAPITVKFEIPYYSVSGIQVRYLKIVDRSGYQALPWVRYITQQGDYQIRTT